MNNWKQILAGLLLLPLLLIGLGMLYETIADARTRRTFPPPGQMIDVGSHRLHLNVMGQPQGQPAVMNGGRRHEGQAGMAMLLIVPMEESL